MHVSYAAQTCHSSDYVTPQCSFTEPVIHCTRKIDAILKVGSADKAGVGAVWFNVGFPEGFSMRAAAQQSLP